MFDDTSKSPKPEKSDEKPQTRQPVQSKDKDAEKDYTFTDWAQI